MSIYLILGIIMYTVCGHFMIKVTNNYLNELEEKVSAIDVRYSDRLYYHVRITDTKFNQFIVGVIFYVFWPALCITMILKAEKEYDIIVHQCAFRNAP